MEYLPVKDDTVLKVDKIYTVHYFQYARDFVFYGERHNFWEMVYIDRGKTGIIGDTKAYNLGRGYAAFHKPGEYHSIWAREGFANSVIITFSSESESMNFFKNKILQFDEECKRLLAKILNEAQNYFEEPLNIVDLKEMTKKKNAPPGGEQLIRGYIEQLLIYLLRLGSQVDTSPVTAASEEGKEKIVDAVISYLKANIATPVTLDSVVENIRFSKTYLKQIFRKVTGTTIMKYLTSLRIDYAKELLSEGGYTVSEISSLCGYQTVHYFSNSFKKETGMTPTEYVKSVGKMGIL